MIQLINKLKKNQKGFTLVELIVVLVILAILAAFTIPAMLGFVNDARGKAGIAEAREVYMAYQSATTELTAGLNDANQKVSGTFSSDSISSTKPVDSPYPEIQKSAWNKLLGDIIKDDDGKGTLKVSNGSEFRVQATDGKVSKVEYLKSGFLITLDMSKASGSEATVKKGTTTDFTIKMT